MLDPLELQLQMVVSQHVGAGNFSSPFCICMVLEFKPQASHLLGKQMLSTSETKPTSSDFIYELT